MEKKPVTLSFALLHVLLRGITICIPNAIDRVKDDANSAGLNSQEDNRNTVQVLAKHSIAMKTILSNGSLEDEMG